MSVKVAINGFGTIGKRVAWAISQQPDMEVVGVSKTKPTYEAMGAALENYPLFIAIPERKGAFEEAGLKVAGSVDDMVEAADIVFDCVPGKRGAANKAMYEAAGVKAVWQGGEKHTTAGTSFNALSNYSESYGKDFVRVVSCNTTGLTRTLFPLETGWGIDNVQAVMVRRAGDPKDSDRGPINSIEPVLNVPSHHGPDVQTVMTGLNIQTMAVKVPTTIMHLHCNIVQFKGSPPATLEVLEAWEATPRVRLIQGTIEWGDQKWKNLPGTAEIMELSRDLGHPRGDFMDIIVWKDGSHMMGDKLYYYQAIHQESDVIPENVDVVRSMFQLEDDNLKSMEMTDRALGLR